MEKTLNKGAAGVSLIEVMISLVLVSLALIAITSVFPNINKHRKGIQEADQAKIIAAEVLDGLQFLTIEGDCDGLSGTDATVCSDFINRYKNKKVTVGIVEYTVNWGTPATASWGGKTVNVTVTWPKGGKTHTVTLTGAL
jgi:Tfp pilus assembly protein PilV